MELLYLGFGNMVSAQRVIAMVNPDSAPVKRLITEARERGVLIDATYGRKTKLVIIADSGNVILSANIPKDKDGHELFCEEVTEDE